MGTQTCTVTDFIFTAPPKPPNMSSLASPSSLHNIPYADQSSLPPLTISMGTAIECSTNTGIGIVTDCQTPDVTTTNQMVSSASYSNLSGNSNSLTTMSSSGNTNCHNSKQQPSEEKSHTRIINQTANNRNETCVRQRNGNFIS